MFPDRRSFLRSTAGLGAAALLSGQARAASKKSLMTKETTVAIRRGLQFLADHQNDDGSFGDGGGYGRNVAICGLAGLAFMSHGSTPGRGPFGRNVNRCIQFLTNNTQDSGFIVSRGAASHGPMYGHGFASLCLAEAYGMAPKSMGVREKLAKAIELIVTTQNDEGGWRYQPQRADADISVTVCQVMALRAARNAGIYVPSETIDRCIDFVKRCQNPDGGFTYMLQGGASRFPRSAAGLVALYSAGIYKGDPVEKGLNYLSKYNARDDMMAHESHYFYGHYYAAQAFWHAGGARWKGWYPTVRDSLVGRQRDDGSWFDAIGAEYATAMAALILQMPNSYLPIFQN